MSKTFLAAASVVTFMAAIPAFASAQEAVHIPNEVISMTADSTGASCPNLTIEHAVVKEALKAGVSDPHFTADINTKTWEVAVMNLHLGVSALSVPTNITRMGSIKKDVCVYSLKTGKTGLKLTMQIKPDEKKVAYERRVSGLIGKILAEKVLSKDDLINIIRNEH